MNATTQSIYRTGVHPGAEGRLLTTEKPESLNDYLDAGGYRPVGNPDVLLAAIARAGLRGRGGAAFPFARKALAVREHQIAPVVLANGEEGEPASVKDRWLLRNRPHLVLDGLRLAAAVVGAQEAYVYLSDDRAAESIREAIAQSRGEGWAELDIRVHQTQPAYVAGEETAAVRSINGGPALPQDKPPRPFEAGVHGRPTLVSNVETLANLPLIQRLGAEKYRSIGTSDSPGTFLLTLNQKGLYEVPFGTTLREVLEWLGEKPNNTNHALVGGYFAGLLDHKVLDLPLEYGALAEAGSGLGCGAFTLFGQETCPVSTAAEIAGYFAQNNAGQCGSCFNGTAAMAAVIEALRDHRAGPGDVERLRTWSKSLRRRGACGTLDGAANIASTLLREFPALVTDHVLHSCEICEG